MDKGTPNKMEVTIAFVITILISGLDLLAYPATWFVNVTVADITPIYFTLIVNQWILIIAGLFAISKLCPSLNLGLGISNLKDAIMRNWKLGIIVVLWFFGSFFIGLVGKFDYQPTFQKVFIEAFFYNISVAIIEELYCRGLLLNIIENWARKHKNHVIIAVVGSSVLFGLGHIPGMIGSVDTFTLVTRIIWTTSLGIYFGAAYKLGNSLWVPIIMHFLVNVSATTLVTFKVAYTYPLVTTVLSTLGAIVFAAICLYLLVKKVDAEENGVGFMVTT